MAGLAQSFLGMAVSSGRARVAGLPMASATEVQLCDTCEADTLHSVAETVVHGTFVLVYTCEICGALSSYAPPPSA